SIRQRGCGLRCVFYPAGCLIISAKSLIALLASRTMRSAWEPLPRRGRPGRHKIGVMSIADAMRVRDLEVRVATLEEMLIALQTRFEARQMAETSAAAEVAPGSCPRCEQRREQAKARLRRHRDHRAKAEAGSGETLLDGTAGNVAGDPSLGA